MIYSSLRNFAVHTAAGILTLFTAIKIIDGVTFEGGTQIILIAGILLGFINCFIKPVIKLITFPLRLITLGLFTFFINVCIIWFVQAVFPEIAIEGTVALIYTTLVACVLQFIVYSILN